MTDTTETTLKPISGLEIVSIGTQIAVKRGDEVIGVLVGYGEGFIEVRIIDESLKAPVERQLIKTIAPTVPPGERKQFMDAFRRLFLKAF